MVEPRASKRNRTLVVWAPVSLEPPIFGDKANELERIRILSNTYKVRVFVLLSLARIKERGAYLRIFNGCGAEIWVLPWIDVYGFRMLSRLTSASVVALAVLLLRVSVGVDLVITRGAFYSIPLIAACKVANVSLLYSIPSQPLSHMETGFVKPAHVRLYSFLSKPADYFVLRNADFWGVASSSAELDLLRFFGKDARRKITSLPFPIPDEFYEATPPKTDDSQVELTYNGSVSYLYDFSSLLIALRRMNSEGKRVCLTIYTSEAGRKQLHGLDTGNGAFLRLQPQMPRGKMIEAVGRATAMVIPLSSRVKFEGGRIPIKAIEAMALRVPVIISNPNDSIFQDGVTCVVVSDDSPEAWEKAISRITDSTSRKSIVNRARVLAERFRSSRNVEIVSQLLDDRKQSGGSSAYPDSRDQIKKTYLALQNKSKLQT
jgi:glycosyltransferase involved in cell wall biosynthesis